MPRHLLDDPRVGRRCFFPTRDVLADPFVVRTGGAELHCYHRAPHPNAPTLLHFHGNGEVVSDWLIGFVPDLLEAGLNVCLGEYRGYGGSSGVPVLAGMLDDSVAIADALGVEPGRLFVYGRSIGSVYALHVAARRRVAGLVLESAISNVLPMLTDRVDPKDLGVSLVELSRAVAQVLDHRSKLRAHSGPVLLLHTRHDQLVPVEHAHELARWAGARGRLVVFEQGDHNSIHFRNRDAILAELLRFTGVSE